MVGEGDELYVALIGHCRCSGLVNGWDYRTVERKRVWADL